MTRKEMTGSSEPEVDAAAGRARLARIRPFLEKRAAIIRAIRDRMRSMDFLEVETPIRISAPAPELHIDTEPSGDRFLAASPELQMKRLVASGAYPRVFQIGRCFRRAERGRLHLPEFTMMEWYRAGAGVDALFADCESIVAAAAEAIGAYPTFSREGATVRLDGPWRSITVREAFARHAGWTPGPSPDPDRFDRDLVEKVEPALPADRPVFLTAYPASMASLARLSPSDPGVAERFELYLCGIELANGFAELTDPREQRARFEKEEAARRAMGKPPYPTDERFLAALEAGMEPCAGIALGVDRLVMLLAGANEIDDVVAFPEGTT